MSSATGERQFQNQEEENNVAGERESVTGNPTLNVILLVLKHSAECGAPSPSWAQHQRQIPTDQQLRSFAVDAGHWNKIRWVIYQGRECRQLPRLKFQGIVLQEHNIRNIVTGAFTVSVPRYTHSFQDPQLCAVPVLLSSDLTNLINSCAVHSVIHNPPVP